MATFNLYNNQADNFAATLISTPSGINVVGQSAVYTGALGAASTFDFLSFGTTIVPQRGILLTSGNGTPPQKNTQPGFGKANNTPGDAQLSQIVTDAFPGDSLTFDANAIAFKIKVDKGIKSVIFDVVFGSEEFPNYVNNFVDIAAIFVNGKNAAFFGGNSANPLSVLDANRNYFQDNTKKGLAIEYNAISKKLTVIAPVHEGINDIKIAIADTKDVWLDSGIFVSDMRGSTRTLSGILNELLGTDGKDKLKAEPDIDNILFGGPGKDKLWVSTGFDTLYGDDEDGPVVAKGLDEVAASKAFKDTFIFEKLEYLAPSIDETDIIADFDKKDVINIAKLAKPKFEFIGKDKFSKDGDPEVRFKPFKKDDYTAVYIDKNGDGKTDASIKLLGVHKLNEDDFVL